MIAKFSPKLFFYETFLNFIPFSQQNTVLENFRENAIILCPTLVSCNLRGHDSAGPGRLMRIEALVVHNTGSRGSGLLRRMRR